MRSSDDAPRAVWRRALDGWRRIGLLVAHVVTPVGMTLLFLLVITPVALLLRALGHRPADWSGRTGMEGGWLVREPSAAASDDMTRPF